MTPNEAITVKGTTDGTIGDHVDINCYTGSASAALAHLATGVSVAADGSISVAISQGLRTNAARTCVLRAVNAGDLAAYLPGSISSYARPTLAFSQVKNAYTAGTQLSSYYLFAAQLPGCVRLQVSRLLLDRRFVYL